MAAPTLASTTNYGSKTQVFVITQSGVNNGSVRLTLSRPIDSITIQVTGTFNGETITLTVGNVAGSEQTPLGTALTFTATGIKAAVPSSPAAAGDEWLDKGWLYWLLTWTATGASSSTTTTVCVKYAA